MSGAPKRLHEEGSHSTPLKRPLEDIGMFYGSGKLIHPSGNDFRVPFQTGQDPRLSKIQRTEPRDIDKRSSLPHRANSSPSNCLDLSITENKSDLRNFKDAKDVKTENREIKADTREFYSDTRVDRQDIKVEKDVRLDSKEIRLVRDPNNDIKADVKFEKDSYITTNSHTSLKETKEHHRAKKYIEQTTDSLDSWRLTRHEASGENKVDMKDEEKFREKDRKRKEEKHRDFSGRDRDRNDHRSNLQLGGAINEYKEPFGEEKDTERWKRERNDAQKEKEQNDKDSDPNKGEASDANAKDESVRISETETVALQPRLHKVDSLRASDNDLKAEGGGMDVDEGDRQEKHEKYCDKEVGDECADGDRVTERKRMLRSRGTPQTPQREPRFRSRAWDNAGSGQSEVSTVVYKPGVCMQELLKLWREFESSKDCKNDERSQNGPTLEIRIPAEYVTATNRQVRGAQLWGTDIYTNDSDLVAVLMHTGYCRPTASPPSAIHELQATVQLLPPQDCYISTLRNNVRSRAWGAGIGCSFFVERCCVVKKGGGVFDLEPRLTHISAVEPTLAPVSVERTMTTRAAASNALRQQRFVREVTVQYNLCNEPWLKYSISIVADKGLKKPLYTSARLKKGEVLYLETHRNRYELCFSGEKPVPNGTITSSQVPETDQAKNHSHSFHASNGERNGTNHDMVVDVFRWSRCKKPLSQKAMCYVGIPLPVDHLKILEDNVEWEDVQWSQTGVLVAGKEYALARVHFLPQTT